jgi:hypothetical protein
MNKMAISLIFAEIFTMGAGMTSTADANGTVKKCAPPRHHVPKHHHHKPHHHPAPCATPECPPCLYHTGFYGGALVGWSRMDVRVKDLFITDEELFESSLLTKKKHKDSVIGELLVGGRYVFHSLCDDPTTVALEVSGTLDDNKVKSNLNHVTGGPDSQIKFKREYAIIPSLVFGKVFCCHWHGFFKIGLGISRFKTKYTNLNDTTITFSKKKTQVGVVPALGLEYAINKCISLVGTAAYEWYPGVNSIFQNTVPPITGTFADDHVKVKPHFYNLKVGILVKV